MAFRKKEIRLAYQETCVDAFQYLTTENGGSIQITETTIVYCRTQNLQDLLTSAKLCEGKGRGGSAFLGLKSFGFSVTCKNAEKPKKHFPYYLYV